MLQKELKKLNRRELVDIIYQLKKNEEELKEQIEALEEALREKRLHIAKAGSIAEAAVDIAGVFSSAQSAADLYLSEIEELKKDTEKHCDQLLGEANKKSEQILAESRARCEEMMENAQRKVDQILSDGKAQYDTLGQQYRAEYEALKSLQAERRLLEQEKTEADAEE